MKPETIMPPNFMGRAANIMEEVRTRTSVDKIATEVIVAILQASLKEYYYDDYELGYSEGHSDGYSLGYALGCEDGYYAR